jgi:hypothetical protein
LEITLKIRFFLVVALLLGGLSSSTLAAKNIHSQHKGRLVAFGFASKTQSTANKTSHTAAKQKNIIAKHSDNVGSHSPKLNHKVHSQQPNTGSNNRVNFDFKRNIEDQLKHQAELQHINLPDNHHENEQNHELHYEDNQFTPIGEPPVNAVPVPAAIWLFGSAMLGFIGLKRKSA